MARRRSKPVNFSPKKVQNGVPNHYLLMNLQNNHDKFIKRFVDGVKRFETDAKINADRFEK